MAGFEGVKWADKQLLYLLKDKSSHIMPSNDKVFAVSRSIHYGLFLAFEGIRFFCKKNNSGKLEVIFVNLHKNLERFRRSISFNLSSKQQEMVPSVPEVEGILRSFLRDPSMGAFLSEMADLGAQGYLRPFTYDEAQSIGVTFPENPSIRAVACRYDKYLGEPFVGVVVPNLVRAVATNRTGCLKLGVNYLMSVKAVDAAKQILPEASAALFLDDRPYEALKTRKISEWDSSCCLFAFTDGTILKIPENPLILPSVTIQGICAILKQIGCNVIERFITYGELIDRAKAKEIVTVCSIGTAGILNRAQRLLMVNELDEVIVEHQAKESHELYDKLGQARHLYWEIYQEKALAPIGMEMSRIEV